MTSFPRTAWVTGAGGFVGRHLAARLDAAGWRVQRARARSGQPPKPEPTPGAVAFHVGGIAGGRRSFSDLVAANAQLPLGLYPLAARAGCRAFVFVSSAKVLGECSAEPLAEQAERRPRGAYATSKAVAEQGLLTLHAQARLPLAIVRPPLVYGPGAKGSFSHLLRALNRGLPLPFADARALRSWVSAANLADALAVLGERTALVGGARIWHVSDGRDASTAELCRALAAALGRRARLFRAPGLAGAAAALAERGPLAGVFGPARLCSARLRGECAWTPPQSLQAALAAVAAGSASDD